MKRRLLLTVIMLCSATWLLAQGRTVSGKVTDKSNNESLAGVTVALESTGQGVFTDVDGNYSINITGTDAVLVFNYVGYAKQKVAVGNQNSINVALELTTEMNEVVITALGIPRDKKAVGYATQKVEGSNISTARETNIVNALQGKVAGVQITGSSNLGGSSRILMRGIKSVYGNNQPLFVVDGVPIENGNYTTADQARSALGYDYGNAIQDIDPSNIEDVQFLKGPAAALYGSRGANGVVLITTKKGKSTGKGAGGIGVTVTENYGFDKVYVLPDYQNTYGGGAAEFDSSALFPGLLVHDYYTDASWGPKMEGQPVLQWYAFDERYHPNLYGKATPWEAHPDNVKNFYKTGTTSNLNVSLDGASDRSTFRLSLSNLNQTGTFENSSLKRNTLGFNGTHRFNDKLMAGTSVNIVTSKGKGRPQTGYNNLSSNFTQWFQRQLDFEELQDYKNPDGSQRTWNRSAEDDPSIPFWDNPYWVMYENYETDRRDRVYGNAYLQYQVSPHLSMKGTVMKDSYIDQRQERVAVGSVSASKYSEQNILQNEMNYEFITNYKNSFGEQHDFNAFAGANRRDLKNDVSSTETQGGLNVPGFYSLTNSAGPLLFSQNYRNKRVNSVFGGVSYGYKGFLFVDLTGRNDWSSTLPADNNSYFYSSASTSLIFSQLVNIPKMSFGKVRLSVAKVGNDTDPYNIDNRLSPVQNFGDFPAYTIPNTLNNPNLRPETVKNWEAGTEMFFFEDRVHLDVTYYQSTTEDNIFPVQVSGSTGYTSMYINAGTLQNKGWEIMTDFTPVRTKNGFEWNVGFNWAHNENKVVSLAEGVESIILQQAPFAVSVTAQEGMAYGQIMGTDFSYYNGQKIIDGGMYVPTATVQPLGSYLAKFTGGINTTLKYKRFKLYTLIDFQKGGHLFSLNNTWGKYSGTLAETADNNVREDGVVLEGVDFTGYDEAGNALSDGTVVNDTIAAIDHFFVNQGYVIGAADVYDASFIKWRELRLTYDFNPAILSKTPIRGLTVGITGRNLAILKKNVPHIDPEAGLSTSNVQGLESGQLPTARNISFMISLKF